MQYNRKELCLLDGIEISQFRNAAHAGQLPIFPNTEDEDKFGDGGSKTYARYSARDVLMVACAFQLAGAGGYISRGIPLGEASKIVWNNSLALNLALVSEDVGAKEIFFGYATFGKDNNANNLGGMNVYGCLGDDLLSGLPEGARVHNLFLISPMAVAADIAKNAEKEGIAWDVKEVWSGDK